jgi:hypothetical protein
MPFKVRFRTCRNSLDGGWHFWNWCLHHLRVRYHSGPVRIFLELHELTQRAEQRIQPFLYHVHLRPSCLHCHDI